MKSKEKTEQTLREFGYKPIASEAHAAQLLRRELKNLAKLSQKPGVRSWSYHELLQIKRGNWYKFSKTLSGRRMLLSVSCEQITPNENRT